MLCSTIRNVVPWRLSARIISPMRSISVGLMPPGGLVEQDQLRVEHQHLRELDELLLAVGQRAGLLVAEALHARRTSSSSSARAGLLAAHRARVELAQRERAQRRDDVLEHGHLAEQARDLERPARARGARAGTAAGRRSAGRRTRPRPPSARIVPSIRLNAVVLPEPFGPISAVIEPCGTANEAVVDGLDAAEVLGKPLTSSSGSPAAASVSAGAVRSRDHERPVEARADQPGLAARAPRREPLAAPSG